MKEAHDSAWAGHPCVEKILALLSRVYFWPKMDDDIEAYVRTFHVVKLTILNVRRKQVCSNLCLFVKGHGYQ